MLQPEPQSGGRGDTKEEEATTWDGGGESPKGPVAAEGVVVRREGRRGRAVQAVGMWTPELPPQVVLGGDRRLGKEGLDLRCVVQHDISTAGQLDRV